MAVTQTAPTRINSQNRPARPEARLVIEHLRKVYSNGFVALDDVSLTIGEGVVGLLGPNGAGKTTLIEILATLLAPTAGRVTFDATDLLRHPQKIRRLLGYLPQTFGLYPNLTVAQFLRFAGRLCGLGGRRLHGRIGEVSEMVRIEHLASRALRGLSGGERRRLGIAQALLNNPRLLVVDEPTSGLDPQERLHFRNLLFDLGRGRVVILSTHLVKDVEFSCGDMIVLHRGRVLFRGIPSELVAMARDKTWEFDIAPGEFDQAHERFHLVTFIEDANGSFRARVVSDGPPAEGAWKVEPNLEDAYILLVGSEGQAEE
jgi:ABC-type multidrug transport system ATPase subunit